jgi:hypothetical protein
MGYKNLEQQQQAVEAAKYENAKRQTRAHVYQKYLRVLPCDANDKLISHIVDRWTDNNPDVLHSLQLFEQAIAENPTEFNSLAKQKKKQTVEQLIGQIIDMLVAHGKGHDAFTLKQERTRLQTFSIPALRTRLADLQVKAKMASTDVASLKNFVAESRRPAPQSKVLPAEYTRERIYLMPSHEIRKLTRDWTASVVNDRLFGRS